MRRSGTRKRKKEERSAEFSWASSSTDRSNVTPTLADLGFYTQTPGKAKRGLRSPDGKGVAVHGGRAFYPLQIEQGCDAKFASARHFEKPEFVERVSKLHRHVFNGGMRRARLPQLDGFFAQPAFGRRRNGEAVDAVGEHFG